MHLDLETFLVTVYSLVDDLYTDFFLPHRPLRGAPSKLSDSEVLTLSILADWCFQNQYAPMLRFVRSNWLEFFPALTTPSSFNKRVEFLADLLPRIGPLLALHIYPQGVGLQIVDGFGMPTRQFCRAKYPDATDAAVGYSGSPKRSFYGFKAVMCVSEEGLILSATFGPGPTDERQLLDALLRWRVEPEAEVPDGHHFDQICGYRHRAGDGKYRLGARGYVESASREAKPTPRLLVVGDKGYKSARLQKCWEKEAGAVVLTPEQWGRGKRYEGVRQMLRRLRQSVERGVGALGKGKALPTLSARRTWSVRARFGAMLARHNLNCIINRFFGFPPLHRIDPLGLERT